MLKFLFLGLLTLGTFSANARSQCTYIKETYENTMFGEYLGPDKRSLVYIDEQPVPVPPKMSDLEFLAKLARTRCSFPSYYVCSVEPQYSKDTIIGYGMYMNKNLVLFLPTYGEDSYFHNRQWEAKQTAERVRDALVNAGVCRKNHRNE